MQRISICSEYESTNIRTSQNSKKRLTGIISSIILISIMLMGYSNPIVQASSNNNDDDNPVSGILRDLAEGIDESDAGTEAGREAAREDFYSGTNSHANCPREAGPWCFGYNTGYRNVMSQLQSAHR